MTPETSIIKDKERLRAYIKQRFDLAASIEPIKRDSSWNTSAAPIMWIQNRLIESGQYFTAGCPPEPDDFKFLHISDGVIIVPWHLMNPARSRIFNTNQLPRPIDLTAARVSVCCYSNKF